MTHPALDTKNSRVLVAGGGPVGLLCAYLLGRTGIPVRVFDVNSSLQADPRAATTHPATLEVLGDAGLVNDMIEVGLVAPIFQFWDRPTGNLIAQFDHALLQNDTRYPFVVQCEQFKTAKIILDRLRALPNVEVLFEHDVVEIEQSADSVTVGVRHAGEIQRHSGTYLIGADGGRSTVRKQSGIEFQGFTWSERFIVLTTPFDFEAGRGYCPRSYFADPDEWCNCFKVSGEGKYNGLWRTVFPANSEAAEADLLSDDAVQMRLQQFFPASQPYEIVHRNLYQTHQRVATSFRKGRVLLAGDAAHVNNPIGGMGLNGGIQDAANLTEKLIQVLNGEASDDVLDVYDRQRRISSVEFVQQQSIENKKRLEAKDPEVRHKNLMELRAIAADPERSRQFLLRSSMITMQRRAAEIS